MSKLGVEMASKFSLIDIMKQKTNVFIFSFALFVDSKYHILTDADAFVNSHCAIHKNEETKVDPSHFL